jgi:hypothetical protein
MVHKSLRGVVCFSLLVGFYTAAPWSRRPPLKELRSALLGCAEQADPKSAESANLPLTPERENICAGSPDYYEASVPEPSPAPVPELRPDFPKDRKQAVLSLIHYPWEDLGYNVVFMGSRLGYRAMTLTARRRIEVYVRPGEDFTLQAYDLAHELGHAFDLKNNDDESRRKWCKLRGINPSTPWFGCDACPDYATPAGDFAETFAYLLLGPGNFHSMMAPAPLADQISDLAGFCKIEHLSEAFNRVPKEIREIKSTKAPAHKIRKSEPARDPATPSGPGYELAAKTDFLTANATLTPGPRENAVARESETTEIDKLPVMGPLQVSGSPKIDIPDLDLITTGAH